MDIEELRIFVEIADSGGVSAAARRLGISKSVASRHLARLEADLGVQLLARTTRGAALTEAGITFRDYAGRACAEIDAARDLIQNDGELRGRLRVAMPLSFGPTHLAPVLADMARKHPQLQIHASYSDRFVDLVAEGFDCAVRFGYLQNSSLVARNVAGVAKEAHALKGVSLNVGATSLAKCAAALEAMAREGKLDRIDVTLEELRSEEQALWAELARG